MPDYGHDIRLGTFLTPQSRAPEEVVALARLSEQVGLDVVSFQDHPYQPAFLDTCTLLSWVAASTSTIHVAPNVLNLPLRPPAVVARAAASLDRLSEGRFDLGLGAGGFLDAVVAMGGPRRSPGESVVALEEAIDVLRQTWDADGPGGVRVDGEHYVVRGAPRGPAPAHDIPIWLGAYKPRILRLTGRLADGWLPTLRYIDTPTMQEASKIIDDAALAAGRDPRAIRRLLNVDALSGSVDDWVEQLLPFVLEEGFSTFLLTGDDPDLIQLLGEDVAPALRQAVDRERAAAATPTGPARGRAALALRADGIDYDRVPAGIEAIEPGDRAYPDVRSTYVRVGAPGLVLRPASPEQVAEALAFARGHEVALSVRSGGHGVSGRSTNDGGIVIDLGHLDEIEIRDPGTGRIRLGPAARWGAVAQALQPYGLGMSSGDYGDVGVGGLATSGGVGYLGRKHGLTIDHVVAADVVLADGRFMRADAEHHGDLFWALRGAGGNFGIVTALELDAYPVGDVVASIMVYDATDVGAFLARWGERVAEAPRELTSFLNLSTGRRQALAQAFTVFASSDVDVAREALAPLANAGPVLREQTELVPYAAVVAPQGLDHPPGPGPFTRAGLMDTLSPAATSALATL